MVNVRRDLKQHMCICSKPNAAVHVMPRHHCLNILTAVFSVDVEERKCLPLVSVHYAM